MLSQQSVLKVLTIRLHAILKTADLFRVSTLYYQIWLQKAK